MPTTPKSPSLEKRVSWWASARAPPFTSRSKWRASSAPAKTSSPCFPIPANGISASMNTSSERLAASRILLVGTGGVGAPCAIALAEAGVGTLVLADEDRVELVNLHRQL